MKVLRDSPIKRKLTVISMLTSSVALLLTCAVIVGFEFVNFRRSMVEDLLATARMVADNSAAALTFDDPAAAELTLRALDAHSHISMAFIYDAEGRIFASYQPQGATPLPPPPVERNVSRFTGDYLEVFRNITEHGELTGTVYLRHDMHELRDNLLRSGFLALSAMVTASIVALLLTRSLLPVVAGPIMNLGEVVRDVAVRKDFSIRAEKRGDDEIGSLIDGFNVMLAEIQQRDAALQAAQDSLEKRVAERTTELASSLSVLNATLESTADGILAIGQTGDVVSYNSKFASMWGMPPEMLQRRDEKEWLAFAASQVVNPEKFIRRSRIQVMAPKKHVFDVIKLKDGRNFERYVQFQHVGEMTVGRVINYRDVTRRKLAEAELAETARQLQETSRRAGMAEVATSVLHNVGNVLNSVNISCSLVAEKVRRSRVGSVAKTAALLHEHSHDLPAFLTVNPVGRKLPAYLAKLAEHLADEHTKLLLELKLLSKNIDHIKEIVAMQQNFARVAGVTENVQVCDLVEDSLRLNQESLANHSVRIVREYSDLPPINTEKHKTLQILVNLIRNAKYACEDSGLPDKQITMRLTGNPDRIQISVIDNGVGIPAENLTRIFAHGFTTKPQGHGFGLHSGAIAARELGGSLSVHSDGPGTGATFTLEIPTHTQI